MHKIKNRFVVCIIIIITAIFLSIFYDAKVLWKYVFSVANVNKDYLATDSVWYNSENVYHNDILLNTLLNSKTCVCSNDSWYVDYYSVFSKRIDCTNNIPAFIDENSINMQNFVEVGYSLAYIHSTLVDHKVIASSTENDIPILYVHADGINDADKVVAVNDDKGNIYLMTEDYWNETSK